MTLLVETLFLHNLLHSNLITLYNLNEQILFLVILNVYNACIKYSFSDQECYELVKKSADSKASPSTTISPYTTSVANTEYPNIFISISTFIINIFLFKEQTHIYL